VAIQEGLLSRRGDYEDFKHIVFMRNDSALCTWDSASSSPAALTLTATCSGFYLLQSQPYRVPLDLLKAGEYI
jgi:hypothetical protein